MKLGFEPRHPETVLISQNPNPRACLPGHLQSCYTGADYFLCYPHADDASHLICLYFVFWWLFLW